MTRLSSVAGLVVDQCNGSARRGIRDSKKDTEDLRYRTTDIVQAIYAEIDILGVA